MNAPNVANAATVQASTSPGSTAAWWINGRLLTSGRHVDVDV